MFFQYHFTNIINFLKIYKFLLMFFSHFHINFKSDFNFATISLYIIKL